MARRTLPESTAWLFPEYEFGKMNPRAYRHVIIERILERGTWSEGAKYIVQQQRRKAPSV